jgi:tetratricopeptide (TPR) repeat protein
VGLRSTNSASAIAQQIGDRLGEGTALGNLGSDYENLGEHRRAIAFHGQHLAIAREIGDRRGEGRALWNLSVALDQLGDRAEAVQHAQASLRIQEDIGDPWAGKVRDQLAQWNASTD